ncbi:MAG: hypothetical protein IKE01_05545 [Clostridia bacterium]|nr:hypothetical protein [Clostridia bacterium]
MEEKKDIKKITIIVESIIIVVLLILLFISVIGLTNNKNTLFTESSINTVSGEMGDKDITISKNKEQTKNDVVKLNLNETVTKESKYELTVLGINFGKTILPPNTGSFYTYYEAKTDGHQYLEMKYDYKNLQESNVRADSITSITIKYDNKYEYTGFCVIEDKDGSFTYANITNIAPLTTGKLHYLFDIPDEVANGEGSIVAKINCGSDTYEIILR